jgi:hypothetical protein
MVYPLVMIYICITAIISTNIFVSLLASTVTRVYDQAVAYNVLQRAISILNEEKSWNNEDRREHIKFIRGKSCNPFVEETQKNRNIKNTEILKLHEEIKEQKDLIQKLETKLDKNVKYPFRLFNLNILSFCIYLE